MKRFFVKRPDGNLMGWGPLDEKWLKGLGEGEFIEADVKKARNPNHHKLFFALLQESFENQDQYKNLTDLLVALKIRCGWYDEHITQDGKLVFIPKSISWAQMDQDTFSEFYGDAVRELADMFGAPSVVAQADESIARYG